MHFEGGKMFFMHFESRNAKKNIILYILKGKTSFKMHKIIFIPVSLEKN